MSLEKEKRQKRKEKMNLLMPGMMTSIKATGFEIPKVSPEIQGKRACDLLTNHQKGMLKWALADYAKKHNCKVSDLEWAFCKCRDRRKNSNAAPLRIRKRNKVEIRKDLLCQSMKT